MIHRQSSPAPGQKVFIAVACYEKPSPGFTWSLFHTGAALAEAGIAHELAIYAGNCHVDDSRNRLTRDFLEGDCTDLVFLDADVAWQAGDFLKLIGYERDVVAGIYPKKSGDDTYPVKFLPGEIWSDADGLIEVQGVPTGFLRIRRAVLESLAKGAATYNAKNDGAYATACIFERQIHNGSRWGGDYVFCRKWRDAGGKIFIDPKMRFEHSGEETWHGSVGQWLRNRAGFGLKAGLEAVAAGRETVDDIAELYEAWDNKFAATPLLLAILARLARNAKGPILECGSGLSSLVIAAANPDQEVYVLENSPVFAEHLRIEANKHNLRNLHIECRPLVNGFYDVSEVLARMNWALALIDGPPRKDGRRIDALNVFDFSQTVVIADDVQDHGGVAGMVDALRRTHVVEIANPGTEARSFAVAAPIAFAQKAAA
jgi:predicted O-methyltransferase YrrM